MALFGKDAGHAGSGIDKPQKRGLVGRLLDTMTEAAAVAPLADPPTPPPAMPVLPGKGEPASPGKS